MINELTTIRHSLADMDCSDKEEVGRIVDAIVDELDDLIRLEVSAEAEAMNVTHLVDPDLEPKLWLILSSLIDNGGDQDEIRSAVDQIVALV